MSTFISLSAPGKSFQRLLGARELHVSPSPLFVSCLSGSQTYFSIAFINLSTKNIWCVLCAWKPGKHLVLQVFHGRLRQTVKDGDSSGVDPCGHGLVPCHICCGGAGLGVLEAQAEPRIVWLPLCSGPDSTSIPGHPAVPWVFQLGNRSVNTPEHLEISLSGHLWNLYRRVLS